jgi:hypothetical protein
MLCNRDLKLWPHHCPIMPRQLVVEWTRLLRLLPLLQVETRKMLKSNVFAWYSISNCKNVYRDNCSGRKSSHRKQKESKPESIKCEEVKFEVSWRWLWRMVSSGMLRRVAFVRTDVSDDLSASFIRVTRIGEPGTTLAVGCELQLVLFLVHRFLSETSVRARATWRTIPEDTILQWRGVLWRRQVLLSCKLINNCF